MTGGRVFCGFRLGEVHRTCGRGTACSIEIGDFLSVSRSETTMVAVGLSPRTAAKHTIVRRGATAERSNRSGVQTSLRDA